ncbi:MAG: LysR family transcriptional regulator [Rhodospirillales bacterium]|nr:LysR family transcriptional regulator [Rhodospirillales bacterium]MBN8906384.1 LysR family transcriptional regulator [Rhodospirillales bacterium]
MDVAGAHLLGEHVAEPSGFDGTGADAQADDAAFLGRSLLNLDGRPLELREMRCFVTVARIGNFGRAARELAIGQPAISHAMQKLEASLGTQLLVRHARGVTLTRAGVRLRDRIEQVMQLLASPLAEDMPADVIDTAPSRRVVLGVPGELGPLLVAPLVEQFRAAWPDLQLELQEGSGAALEEWLLGRRVDVAVLQDPASREELQVRPVLSETIGLVTSVRSPLAESSDPLRVRDIDGLKLILPTRQHWIRRRLEQAAFQAGITLDAATEVDSCTLAKAMVRSGLGCTVLPGTAVQEELARGSLAFRALIRPSLSTTHAIALRRAGITPAVRDLARMLHGAMVALVQQGTWTGAHLIRTEADERSAAAESSFVETGERMD